MSYAMYTVDLVKKNVALDTPGKTIFIGLYENEPRVYRNVLSNPSSLYEPNNFLKCNIFEKALS